MLARKLNRKYVAGCCVWERTKASRVRRSHHCSWASVRVNNCSTIRPSRANSRGGRPSWRAASRAERRSPRRWAGAASSNIPRERTGIGWVKNVGSRRSTIRRTAAIGPRAPRDTRWLPAVDPKTPPATGTPGCPRRAGSSPARGPAALLSPTEQRLPTRPPRYRRRWRRSGIVALGREPIRERPSHSIQDSNSRAIPPRQRSPPGRTQPLRDGQPPAPVLRTTSVSVAPPHPLGPRPPLVFARISFVLSAPANPSAEIALAAPRPSDPGGVPLCGSRPAALAAALLLVLPVGCGAGPSPPPPDLPVVGLPPPAPAVAPPVPPGGARRARAAPPLRGAGPAARAPPQHRPRRDSGSGARGARVPCRGSGLQPRDRRRSGTAS